MRERERERERRKRGRERGRKREEEREEEREGEMSIRYKTSSPSSHVCFEEYLQEVYIC